MKAGETMSFDWKVSSESNYDFLYFFVNGTQNGSGISGTTNWATNTYTAPSDGTYNFEWRYTKDTSVSSGSDCGYVDNVYYVSSITPGDGDVNLDGFVTSEDALLALRYAMGMQDLSAEQIAQGDVNGDGQVTAEDALIILRRGMGIS